MQKILVVFVGAGIGGVLRYWTYVLAGRHLGLDFPWGTLIVNIVGSTIMGLLTGWLAFRGDATQIWRLFLGVGILGGFTTFSSFSLDLVSLFERGAITSLAIYLAASLLVSVAGLWLGLMLVRQMG